MVSRVAYKWNEAQAQFLEQVLAERRLPVDCDALTQILQELRDQNDADVSHLHVKHWYATRRKRKPDSKTGEESSGGHVNNMRSGSTMAAPTNTTTTCGETSGGDVSNMQPVSHVVNMQPIGHVSNMQPIGHVSNMQPIGHVSNMQPVGHVSNMQQSYSMSAPTNTTATQSKVQTVRKTKRQKSYRRTTPKKRQAPGTTVCFTSPTSPVLVSARATCTSVTSQTTGLNLTSMRKRSTSRKTKTSFPESVTRCPQLARMLSSPVNQNLASPVKQIMTSPGKPILISPINQIMTSPVNQIMTSPVNQIMTSPVNQIMTSPGKPILISPVNQILTSPVKPIFTSPRKPVHGAAAVPSKLPVMPQPGMITITGLPLASQGQLTFQKTGVRSLLRETTQGVALSKKEGNTMSEESEPARAIVGKWVVERKDGDGASRYTYRTNTQSTAGDMLDKTLTVHDKKQKNLHQEQTTKETRQEVVLRAKGEKQETPNRKRRKSRCESTDESAQQSPQQMVQQCVAYDNDCSNRMFPQICTKSSAVSTASATFSDMFMTTCCHKQPAVTQSGCHESLPTLSPSCKTTSTCQGTSVQGQFSHHRHTGLSVGELSGASPSTCDVWLNRRWRYYLEACRGFTVCHLSRDDLMYLLAYAQVNESPDDDECLKYITRRVNVDTKHILAWFAYYREVIEPNCPRVSYYSSLLNLVDRLLDTGTFSVEDISVFIS